MRIVIGLVLLVLLLGCIGEEERPPPVIENETGENETQAPPVTIIIGEQKNQTIEENVTGGPILPIPEENETGPGYTEQPDDALGIYFINVSSKDVHGDAILLKKGDFDVLFDAGPEAKGPEVVDFLRSKEVDDIDLLVSTNADPRHYGGLKLVASRFEIERLWWSGDRFYDEEYGEAIDTIMEMAGETREVQKGYSEEFNGINFEILHPDDERFEDINNDAIVTRITDRNFTLLLTSGINKGARERIVNQQPDKIKAQVIQAPYYGTGQGTKDIQLMLVTAEPEVMIISGSKDDSPENGGSREPYIRLMEQHGIVWYATYGNELGNGTMRITTDGRDYAVQPLGE